MNAGEILRRSFERVAGHLANLELVQSIIQEIEEEGGSIEDIIQMLEVRMGDSEVTVRTDLRILLNEIQRMARKSKG